MAHESFENPDIAALMNAALRQHQGRSRGAARHRRDLPERAAPDGRAWRLAPDDVPDPGRRAVLGRHLFPAGAALGPPELSAGAARRSRAAYRDKREDVAKNVAALREGLRKLSARSGGAAAAGDVGIPAELFDRIAERLLREVDPLNGGIGTAPKFPQSGIFELLWRAWKRTRQPPYKDAVTRTLTTIGQGGIYDHLGGGWARYSADARWLVPHFEKMLYDNAELIGLLSLVWQETRDPLYATAGRRDGRLARSAR